MRREGRRIRFFLFFLFFRVLAPLYVFPPFFLLKRGIDRKRISREDLLRVLSFGE